MTKRFGATVALRGVSCELEPGAVNLVLGPNGSGKSTLLGVLGGTVSPTAGEVAFEPESAAGGAERARVGWLSHETLAYGELSGRRNLELAARYYGLDPAEAWRGARDRFQLGGFAERPVRTNSRGQRQRIAMARAFLHAPELVLLDEPSTGLDEAGLARLLEVVGEELERGVLLVVVAHDPEVFARLPCRRWRMDRGALART